MPHRTEAVQILAPFGSDAKQIFALLSAAGLNPNIVDNQGDLTHRIADGTGAVVITEEGAAGHDWTRLAKALLDQPSWSAIPFIFLVSSRRTLPNPLAIQAKLPPEASNVMVLERPMGSVSLVSAVQWALAGRRRQFQTRDHLAELQRQSAQQRLLTRELAHRVKNTIAVLQSIVSQTLRNQSDMKTAELLVLQRFAALARAHDLLLSADFRSSDFSTLVRASLETQVLDRKRLVTCGPTLEVSPQAALSFALVFHELATNAAKYGALTVPAGRIEVSWNVADVSDMKRFMLSWEEVGGPSVAPPTRSGFGSRLIRSSLAGLGDVELRYRPTGLQVTLDAPLDRVTQSVVPTELPVFQHS